MSVQSSVKCSSLLVVLPKKKKDGILKQEPSQDGISPAKQRRPGVLPMHRESAPLSLACLHFPSQPSQSGGIWTQRARSQSQPDSPESQPMSWTLNLDGPEAKESSKVTKQEPPRRSERISAKTVLPKPEAKPKKTIAKVADDKGVKAKKGGAKGKKEDGPAQNGETKTNEIYVSRPSVRVSSIRSMAPSLMSVRGQSDTVRVKGN
ncbi:high mobility group nucleosome-binding domain-containing protein 3 isoform X2 [Antennarius striatus]|uniref:high mobility group nucleosome-binding domain-containing protein 3 isoform X2 n=1 Tax=Antennarius striatus TaxID=241820 RepID=UPI0035B3CF59